MENRLFKGKQIGSSTASVIMELVLPSKCLSGMGLMEQAGILNFWTREWSRKQWVEPESTKAFLEMCGNDSEVILSTKDVDEGIELALSFTSTCMCTESMQPAAHVRSQGCWLIFCFRCISCGVICGIGWWLIHCIGCLGHSSSHQSWAVFYHVAAVSTQ